MENAMDPRHLKNLGHQSNLLAKALRDLLIAQKVIRPDAAMNGPELLMAAQMATDAAAEPEEATPPDQAADLRETAETLHDFRQFWLDNVTQTKSGAGQHNPMWSRVAAVLDRQGLNEEQGYRQLDPAYRCA